MTSKKIKVLIVEDSPVRMKLLEHILEQDKEIKIIGFAKRDIEVLNFLKKDEPDIITMDIHIQGNKNGFELCKLINKDKSIPIIIISAIRNIKNTDNIKNAMMNCGALYFIDAPPGPWSGNFKKASENIIKIVRSATNNDALLSEEQIFIHPPVENANMNKVPVILIGVSTGGPPILSTICSGLPKNFKYPVIIAQHISEGFDQLLADHINSESKLNVKIAKDKEIPRKGTIYFVPAGKLSEFHDDRIVISDPPKNYKGHLPSISMLFTSAVSYYGHKTVAIILTGMGIDGTNELLMLKKTGAITIAQNEASSTVYGMPKAAIKLHAAEHIFSPDEIVDFLNKLNDNPSAYFKKKI